MFKPMAAPLRTSAEHPPHFHPGAALLAGDATKALGRLVLAFGVRCKDFTRSLPRLVGSQPHELMVPWLHANEIE